MANREEVGVVMRLLAYAYPSTTLNNETPGVYAQLLADIDPDRLKAAALQHIAESPFFPKVSELRNRVWTLARRGTPDEETGVEAWARVMDAVRRYGYPRPAEAHTALGDEIWDCLRVAGGFIGVCNSEDITHDRARFAEAFDARRKRRGEEERLLPQVRALIDGETPALSAPARLP